jgi:hypothetical protein
MMGLSTVLAGRHDGSKLEIRNYPSSRDDTCPEAGDMASHGTVAVGAGEIVMGEATTPPS